MIYFKGPVHCHPLSPKASFLSNYQFPDPTSKRLVIRKDVGERVLVQSQNYKPTPLKAQLT